MSNIVSNITKSNEHDVSSALFFLYQMSKDFCRFIQQYKGVTKSAYSESNLFEHCFVNFFELPSKVQQELTTNFLSPKTFTELESLYENKEILDEKIIQAKYKLTGLNPSKSYNNKKEILQILDMCYILLQFVQLKFQVKIIDTTTNDNDETIKPTHNIEEENKEDEEDEDEEDEEETDILQIHYN